jgi:hypothetical protein
MCRLKSLLAKLSLYCDEVNHFLDSLLSSRPTYDYFLEVGNHSLSTFT